jgi:cell division protein FtsZ
MGYAVMGTAVASGPNRAVEAATRAISSPLLEDASINGAQGILINVTGSGNLRLQEVHEASMIIQQAAHEDANIIFGAVLDEAMEERLKITVIATGFRLEAMGPRKRIAGGMAAAAPANPVRREAAWSAAPRVEAHAGPVISIDQEDLDIPAFLRRKTEGVAR